MPDFIKLWQDKNLITTILLNAENIFKYSELIFTNEDAKNGNLKGLQKVYRYAVPIKYNNETYIVITTVFNNTKTQQIKAYHIAGYKKEGTDAGQQKMPRTNTFISISQLKDFVKSKLVQKYNNDYQNAIKNNKSQNVFYQSGYHGSAANFDKFDDDFIGSSESAQVSSKKDLPLTSSAIISEGVASLIES